MIETYVLVPVAVPWSLTMVFNGYIGIRSILFPAGAEVEFVTDTVSTTSEMSPSAKRVYTIMILGSIILNILWSIGAALWVSTNITFASAAILVIYNGVLLGSILAPKVFKGEWVVNAPMALVTGVASVILSLMYLVSLIQK